MDSTQDEVEDLVLNVDTQRINIMNYLYEIAINKDSNYCDTGLSMKAAQAWLDYTDLFEMGKQSK